MTVTDRAWIGVDLDGTLAHYTEWGDGEIGAPIPAMVERVKKWIAAGKQVRIMTARVAPGPAREGVDAEYVKVSRWCMEHLHRVLPVTHEKDYLMIELWDDRCVAVEQNTGRAARWKNGKLEIEDAQP